jgi:small conductance mechanosensitive channel
MLERETANFIIDVHALLPLIVSTALTVLGATLILVIGLWLSGRASMLVDRMLARAPNFDAMLRSFFGSLARYLILAVTVLAALSQFGIQTASLVAVFGAAGLAVGLALQGTLSHLAAGVMLLIVRPFRTGHIVQVCGSIGTVTDLTLFWTELVTDDKVQIIVPNAASGVSPCETLASIRHRRSAARCASGSRKMLISIPPLSWFGPSSELTVASSPILHQACCSTTAPATTL